eukprot:TRINITY_DN9374_c0_g1_i1.p1 TRINITY_DN9374_c0_g1~~TRINITY_DN9374_c0_g1_i1.p1  ORF type:complete len:582 (-),score=36.36 TRINITY_DN9374_c0_g1_i1:91-1836(-)
MSSPLLYRPTALRGSAGWTIPADGQLAYGLSPAPARSSVSRSSIAFIFVLTLLIVGLFLTGFQTFVYNDDTTTYARGYSVAETFARPSTSTAAHSPAVTPSSTPTPSHPPSDSPPHITPPHPTQTHTWLGDRPNITHGSDRGGLQIQCQVPKHHIVGVLPCDAATVGEEVMVLGPTPENGTVFLCVWDFNPTPVDFTVAGLQPSRIPEGDGIVDQSNCMRLMHRYRPPKDDPMRYYIVPDPRTVKSVVVTDAVWVDSAYQSHYNYKCKVPSIPKEYLHSHTHADLPLVRAVVTMGIMWDNFSEPRSITRIIPSTKFSLDMLAPNVSWTPWYCDADSKDELIDIPRSGIVVMPTAADITVYTKTSFAELQVAKTASKSFEETISALHKPFMNGKQSIEQTDQCILGMCTMVQNEPLAYIKQWIEHHRLIGVKHFFLYDNNSTVPLHRLLSEYLSPNIYNIVVARQRANSSEEIPYGKWDLRKPVTVHVIDWKFPRNPQNWAFSHCLELYGAHGNLDFTAVPLPRATAKKLHLRRLFKTGEGYHEYIYKPYFNPLISTRISARGSPQCEYLGFMDRRVPHSRV